MAQRLDLHAELAEATDLAARTHKALRPYEPPWDYAHAALLSIYDGQRERWIDKTADERLAMYDHRLHAGHARNPYKRAYDDAERWRSAIVRELKIVNAELQRLEKPPPLKAPPS